MEVLVNCCTIVCMYVCMYVCIFIDYINGCKTIHVTKGTPSDNTMINEMNEL